ncbi:MAG: hypothetical protein WB507_02900 [Solirubrobacterales bacterium]
MASTRGPQKLPNRRGDPKWIVPFLFAIAGVSLTLISWQRCTYNPGGGSLIGPEAQPSQVCRSTHLFPGSFGSVLSACVVSLAPAMVMIVVSVIVEKTERKGFYWVGLLIAVLLLLGEVSLLRDTHLGFLPEG